MEKVYLYRNKPVETLSKKELLEAVINLGELTLKRKEDFDTALIPFWKHKEEEK